MLAGDQSFVKVDRMMIRFMIDSIGYVPEKRERKMIMRVCDKIGNISPRFLDHQIWLYQRIKMKKEYDNKI